MNPALGGNFFPQLIGNLSPPLHEFLRILPLALGYEPPCMANCETQEQHEGSKEIGEKNVGVKKFNNREGNDQFSLRFDLISSSFL